jgi:FtsP/CotA-like multicopper oxidase with cupredoxin domain
MKDPVLSRRDALKVSVLGAAALALPWQSMVSAKSASRIASSKLPRPYTVPFAVPPVLAPARTDATTDYYRVVQQPFLGEILPGVRTPLWGYNGLVPGPTIKATRGRRTVVRQINALPETHPTLGYVPWTSTHLHGMPAEPQYDGYASDISYPGPAGNGQWKDYVYPNTCEARTLWYHDHGVHHTAENVYMGLAAQYHVSDDIEQALPLPRGRYDVPLIISDVMFARDGSLMWDDDDRNSLFGDVILVNGRPWPTMAVEQRTYRFRLLNAALSRGLRLRLSNGQPFHVIATDGGLVSAPIPVTELLVGMAERYEIIIDFSALPPGQKIRLVNRGVKNAKDYDHTGKVMQFHVSGPATDTSNAVIPPVLLRPDQVHPVMRLTPAQAKKKRRMRLKHDDVTNIWSIDDKTWQDVVDGDYEPVFANPQPGDVEIWEIDSRSGGWFHPLHIHFVDFRVLSRNGRPPRPEENGPKDVVYVGEGETIRLLMQFSEPRGTQGRYMIHCHNLTHEDHDMMTQYQIGDHGPDNDPIWAAPPRPGPAPLEI